MTVPWTSKEVAQLYDLVQTGWTAEEIGKAMDPPKTRCSVLGKCARLGLKVGRARKVAPIAVDTPSEPRKSPAMPIPEPVERGPLCGNPTCRNTKQPGKAWCADHTPLPARHREHMVDIFERRF